MNAESLLQCPRIKPSNSSQTEIPKIYVDKQLISPRGLKLPLLSPFLVDVRLILKFNSNTMY